jgi:hypothetical protein
MNKYFFLFTDVSRFNVQEEWLWFSYVPFPTVVTTQTRYELLIRPLTVWKIYTDSKKIKILWQIKLFINESENNLLIGKLKVQMTVHRENYISVYYNLVITAIMTLYIFNFSLKVWHYCQLLSIFIICIYLNTVVPSSYKTTLI